MKIVTIAAMIAAAAVPSTGWAQSAAPAAAPAAASTARPLDVLANYFLPVPIMEKFIDDSCDAGLRTQLLAKPDMAAAEKLIPGLLDRQVTATANYCRREIHDLLSKRQEGIRQDWARSTKPADIARLAKLLGPLTEEVTSFDAGYRPGEKPTEAAARLTVTMNAMPGDPAAVSALKTALKAFVRTPADAALIDRLLAYADKEQAANAEPGGSNYVAMMTIIQTAMTEGYRAANALAAEKGYPALYSDVPAAPAS